MPNFVPFSGTRYAQGGDIAKVAAPPYDVVDDHERVGFEALDAHNAIRLILPQDEHAEGDRYQRAAATLSAWKADGTLVVDASPRFYGYRMEFTGPHGEARHTIGVLGALALPDVAGEGDILPHERTMPKAKSDRLDLLRATRANVDPIWGLSLTEGLTALIDQSNEIAHCIDELGIQHRLYAIDDPTQQHAITAAVAASPMVLADGHHRFETGIKYRMERRADGILDVGDDAIMALVVELADEQLCIQPIHRLVTLPDGFDIHASLQDAFELIGVPSLAAAGNDAMVLVDGEGLWLMHPRHDVTNAALADESPEVRGTDAAMVEHVVVQRWPDAQWVFRHDDNEIVNLVRNSTYSAGLVLRAPTVAVTRAASFARVRMPQKTTFFYPKPRTGMVFREL